MGSFENSAIGLVDKGERAQNVAQEGTLSQSALSGTFGEVTTVDWQHVVVPSQPPRLPNISMPSVMNFFIHSSVA
jgi:hypothetical protein